VRTISKITNAIQHKGLMKYLKNTSWLLAEKVFRMIVSLFVGIWVARYLGPEQFGLLSFAQSFSGMFTVIAGLGLNGILVRELVKGENNNDDLIGTAFWLKLLGAFISLLILFVAINFTSNDSTTNILIFIIASAAIFQSFNVVDFYFQSKVMSQYVVYANVISLFISSVFKIILILNEAVLVDFAWVVLFDSVILSIGFIFFYIKKRPSFTMMNIKFDKKIAVDLLRDSWPLIFAGIAISINMRIDQVMLKALLGIESVGHYAAAVRIIEVIAILPHMVCQSIFPSFVNNYKNNKLLFISRLKKVYCYLFYGGVFVSICLYACSNLIIQYTFGDDYLLSAVLLQVYSLAIILASIAAVNSIYLKVTGMQKKIMNRQIINVFINVVLNYYLIQYYGVVGAVYATLIALFISSIFYDLFDKSLNEMNKIKLTILTLR
jgi:O-antigen/teichoic acid export membrane protein